MPYRIIEILIILLEAATFMYLLSSKIGTRPQKNHRVILVWLLYSSITSLLTLYRIPIFIKLPSLFLCLLGLSFWAFDWRKKENRYTNLIWSAIPFIISTSADYIAYSLGILLVGDQLSLLAQFGQLRIQFMLLYVLIVALIIWLIVHWDEKNTLLPRWVSVAIFLFVALGSLAVQILISTIIKLHSYPALTTEAQMLTILGYALLFFMFLLLISCAFIGQILAQNQLLRKQKQQTLIEEQQYQFALSTAESLNQWKHDYQGQLRLISTLIEEENYRELSQFSTKLHENLSLASTIPLTGNRTLDAILSLRLMDAQRQEIPLETTLYLPERLELEEVAFSAILGNILDNALEASLQLAPSERHIHFSIKPFKKMLHISCRNTSHGHYKISRDGTLLSTKTEKGHGIGLKRVQTIANELGGSCQISPEANQFSINVMIPRKDDTP